MSDFRTAAIAYAQRNRARFLDELKAVVAIPSISTDPDHRADMQRCADWLVARLHSLGAGRAEAFPTAGHPVVYGEFITGAGRPTVLIYGHYDVQPVDPVDLWQSPPFDPTPRGDNLYARGASDNKGQIMAALAAVESVIHSGGLPLNVKFLFEGEEEIGSPSLDAFLIAHKEMLTCDLCLNPDAGMISAEDPTITYGLRGLAYFELRLFGPAHDLHSGLFGGVIHNPAQALCELIAGMHDGDGRVTLPGFYDRVCPLSAEERAEIARLPINDDFFQQATGAPALWGERGFTAAERTGARPTLEVNGIVSGFTGVGGKTVIPAQAMAKVSMRLVPDQDPAEVQQQLTSYLEVNVPPTLRWELIPMQGGRASITDRQSPGVQALSRALETVWGRPPFFKREGGSIPVVAQMQQILGVDSALTGFGLPDDNVHAPNEKLHLPTWRRGIEAIVHFLYNMAA
jgi:acetylornithine deacetylase/succinyl-diaminopimelate desuccinylase-like protein